MPEMGFGRSRQLLLNQLFDLNTPSMRKGCDGEEKKWKLGESSGHIQSIYTLNQSQTLDLTHVTI